MITAVVEVRLTSLCETNDEQKTYLMSEIMSTGGDGLAFVPITEDGSFSNRGKTQQSVEISIMVNFRNEHHI